MTKRKLQKHLQIAEHLIDKTFTEIIDAIDRYKAASGLEFLNTDNAAPGEYIFDRYDKPTLASTLLFDRRGVPKASPGYFSHPLERWLVALAPRAAFELDTISKSDERSHDLYMDLSYDVLDFGYILGFLVGSRTMGASDADMKFKLEIFKDNILPWCKSMFEREMERGKKKTHQSEQKPNTPPESPEQQLLALVKSITPETSNG